MAQLAVIFDLDGVLVDSYGPHFDSWRRLYGELNLPYDEGEFAKDFGRTSRDILRRTLGDDLPDECIRELDTRKEAYFRDSLRESFPAMDGARELVDALVAADFQLAVGSSGPPENIALVLEKLERADHFAAVVTGSDVTRGKPDPQVFQMAAERLGAAPADCAVIEDAVHGIEAARRAGMTSIGLTGTTDRSTLAAAHLVVDSLRELNPERIGGLIRQTARHAS